MPKTNESKELETVLLGGANVLRSKMDANEYKNYLLGIVFYKYLSDRFLVKAYDLIMDGEPEKLEIAQDVYEKSYADDAIRDDLIAELKSFFHFAIEPELTYTNIAKTAASNTFQREKLQKAFNAIEQSDPLYADLFRTVDLYSNNLGTNAQKQSNTVSDLIIAINKANLLSHNGDVLGDAYEYLIGQFASETGKKAGEFYTPKMVAQILDRIAIDGQEDKKGLTTYDPCMGSGSLMLNMRKYSKYPELIRYYGQELIPNTYNLARMNLILHGVDPENQHLSNGDTLDSDWPTDEPTNFDTVVMNPPYSQKWDPKQGFLSDPRFSDYGVLAPKGAADYAFLLHGFYHLKNTGTMAIVLPHGVLFRSGTEGKIREKLLQSGAIYAVIGLPANLFYNTTIPTCILILKKDRVGRDVLFINAKDKFVPAKGQNAMREEDIDFVIDTYKKRENIDKISHLASYDEITENDFNLNIPRYVDMFEEDDPVDIEQENKNLEQLDTEITTAEDKLAKLLKEIGLC